MKKIILGILVIFSFVQGIFAREVVCEKATTTYKSTFVPKGGSFTLSLFINVKGYTDKKKQEWPNGMVVSCGSGYYDGWRLTIAEENNLIPYFEVGRPEIGSISLRADFGLSKNNIHHLAIVWDESNKASPSIKIYIDGNLAGEKNINILPILDGREIVIGYNDFGVGELDATIFGVTYFNEVLDGKQIREALRAGLDKFLNNETDFNQCFYKQIYSNQTALLSNNVLALINKFRAKKFSSKELFLTQEQYFSETNYVGSFTETQINNGERIVLNISGATNENEFRNEYNAALEKIKALRSSGNNTCVEIIFPKEIFLFGESFVIENLNNVIFSSGSFCGYEAHKISEAKCISSDSRFNSQSKNIYQIKLDTPYSFVPYNCSTPHGQGTIVWKKNNDKNITLQLSMYPESGYIDAKADGEEIKLSDTDFNKIKNEPYLLAHGYWKYFWADAATQITLTENNLSFKLLGAIPYGLGEKPRYRFMNIFSELDKEEEYCIDENHIYFVETKLGEGQICFTKKATPFFIIKNCKNISFNNFKFEGTLSPAIQIKKVEGLKFENVIFENIGSSALLLSHVTNTDVTNSEFKNTGSCGIRIWAGDRKNLNAPNVIIRNTSFEKTGCLVKTYTPSIYMDGYGIVVQNCSFMHTPSSALRIEGSGHIIEKCYFENNVLESDDQGVIDMWGDPSYRGCVFRYNTFKNIGDGTNQECGRAAIRFDDMISGMYVYGNTFINTSRGNFGAVQIHGGSHNLIFNNKFIDCNYGVSFTPRGKEIFEQKREELQPKLRDYNSNALYLHAYPSLMRMNEDYDINFVFNNSFINCKKSFHGKQSNIIFFSNTASAE